MYLLHDFGRQLLVKRKNPPGFLTSLWEIAGRSKEIKNFFKKKKACGRLFVFFEMFCATHVQRDNVTHPIQNYEDTDECMETWNI